MAHARRQGGAARDPALGERDDLSPYAALDDRFYVVAHTSLGIQDEPRVEVSLADLDGGAPRPLVSVRSLGGVMYDPSSRMLVLQADDRMIRYTIDERGATHPRAALRLADSTTLVPLDPAAAHGTVAVAMDTTVEGVHLLAFHDATTGATLVTACGWRFGLHDHTYDAVYGVETACE